MKPAVKEAEWQKYWNDFERRYKPFESLNDTLLFEFFKVSMKNAYLNGLLATETVNDTNVE